MSTDEAKILRVFRLLTPERRMDLLASVHLAYAAENSVRKSLGLGVLFDGESLAKLREYSCENLLN